MLNVILPGGLGDAMAAAAGIQYICERDQKDITFVTQASMKPILRDHPRIHWASTPSGDDQTRLLWASQYLREQGTNIWHLHIKQKYSMQMGFYLDPTYVVDIYDGKEKVKNKGGSGTVVINTTTNLPTKRFIPKDILNNIILPAIEEKGYKASYVGKGGNEDIESCIEMFKTAELYIGPISGMAYIAEAIDIPRVIFCSSVPYYKDMSFHKLTPIMQQEPCILDCEHPRDQEVCDGSLYQEMGCEAINCKGTFNRIDTERLLASALWK